MGDKIQIVVDDMKNLLQDTQVVILAGGLGSRLAELTKKIPKPMVKIGNKPLIEHIIQLYVKHGFKNFLIAGGYKFKIIKQHFKKFKKNNVSIQVINTGVNSLTATRILKLKKYLNKKSFMITYGDGVCDINLRELLNYHKRNKKILTLTAVHPQARFGELEIKKNLVKRFNEKPQLQKGWINGGFLLQSQKFLNFYLRKIKCLKENQSQN